MNKPQSNSPRARLQQLRAIPDRDRTEEEWDELNELEIMLAAENRHPGPGQGHGQGQGQAQGNRPKGGAPGSLGKPQPGPHGNQPQRKFHKRPRRRKGPPGPNG
jgi:hypothetical protein